MRKPGNLSFGAAANGRHIAPIVVRLLVTRLWSRFGRQRMLFSVAKITATISSS